MDWSKFLNGRRLRKTTREKDIDPRNEFESDFGRLIFSPATRRMHDKTQVFPLTSDDNIHSRLTHSLEVLAIGYSLGLRLCQDEDFIKFIEIDKYDAIRQIPILLKNACLVHDIGNPPFGHFGETVIKDYFKILFKTNPKKYKLTDLEKEDFIHFDGNAQGFRVLTKLQVLNDKYGLNLTYGTLGSFLKYPNSKKIDESILSQSKRGVFQSEADYLDKIGTGCGLMQKSIYIRHPLSYLMEAADSICYLVMDIEDGCNKGWFNYDYLKKSFYSIKGLKKKFDELDAKKIRYGRNTTKLVNLRIHLISRLVALAVENFTKNIKAICNGTYKHELIYDDKTGLAKALKNFCSSEIFPKREIQSLELTGHSVLSGLLDYYIKFLFHEDKHYRKRAKGLISASIIRVALIENKLKESDSIDKLNDYYKLRIIVDFITGMTDQFALDHYQKLSGQKII